MFVTALCLSRIIKIGAFVDFVLKIHILLMGKCGSFMFVCPGIRTILNFATHRFCTTEEDVGHEKREGTGAKIR